MFVSKVFEVLHSQTVCSFLLQIFLDHITPVSRQRGIIWNKKASFYCAVTRGIDLQVLEKNIALLFSCIVVESLNINLEYRS